MPIDPRIGSKTTHAKVVLWGLGARERTSLEMTLEKLSAGRFIVCSDHTAALAIVDLDYGPREKIWQDFRARFPQIPALAVSVRAADYPGALYLAKPFRVQALLDALQQLQRPLPAPVKQTEERQQATVAAYSHGAAGTSAAPPSATRQQPASEIARSTAKLFGAATGAPPSSAPTQTTSEPTSVVTGKGARRDVDTRPITSLFDLESVQQYCGEAPDLPAAAWTSEKAETYFFSPQDYLLSELLTAVESCQQSGQVLEIPGPGLPFRLFPGKPVRIANPYRDNVMRSLAIVPKRSDAAEVPHALDDATKVPRLAEPSEQLIWKVALWTARGRLPEGISPLRPVRMTRWPNFTRLALTPHALRIAAAWVKAPASPLELASVLGIPQRYVFAVFTAAWSVGLIQTNTAPVKTAPPPPPASKSGLLKRLLSHLGMD